MSTGVGAARRVPRSGRVILEAAEQRQLGTVEKGGARPAAESAIGHSERTKRTPTKVGPVNCPLGRARRHRDIERITLSATRRVTRTNAKHTTPTTSCTRTPTASNQAEGVVPVS